MLSRVGNGVDDVASCTSSPAAVWRVPLVTVPIRLTVAPGVAYCGFIELMVTETRPVAAGRAGLAWAGLASTMMAGAAGRGVRGFNRPDGPRAPARRGRTRRTGLGRTGQHHDGRGHHRRDGEDRSHGQYPPLDLGRQHAVHQGR